MILKDSTSHDQPTTVLGKEPPKFNLCETGAIPRVELHKFIYGCLLWQFIGSYHWQWVWRKWHSAWTKTMSQTQRVIHTITSTREPFIWHIMDKQWSWMSSIWWEYTSVFSQKSFQGLHNIVQGCARLCNCCKLTSWQPNQLCIKSDKFTFSSLATQAAFILGKFVHFYKAYLHFLYISEQYLFRDTSCTKRFNFRKSLKKTQKVNNLAKKMWFCWCRVSINHNNKPDLKLSHLWQDTFQSEILFWYTYVPPKLMER